MNKGKQFNPDWPVVPRQLAQGLKEWRCSGCQWLLGIVEMPNICRIRVKDSFVTIIGGTIITKCRSCGVDNQIKDEAPEAKPAAPGGKENGV